MEALDSSGGMSTAGPPVARRLAARLPLPLPSAPLLPCPPLLLLPPPVPPPFFFPEARRWEAAGLAVAAAERLVLAAPRDGGGSELARASAAEPRVEDAGATTASSRGRAEPPLSASQSTLSASWSRAWMSPPRAYQSGGVLSAWQAEARALASGVARFTSSALMTSACCCSSRGARPSTTTGVRNLASPACTEPWTLGSAR